MEVWWTTQVNILIINYEYPPIGGGAANASLYLSKAFEKQGHKVVVITSAFKDVRGSTIEGNIHICRLAALRNAPDRSNIIEMVSFMFLGLLRAKRIVSNHQIDSAIVFFTVPCGPIAFYLKRKLNIPYIISLRGGDVPGHVPSLNYLHRLLKRFRQAILRSADHIIANSKGLAELSYKTDPFCVEVIPNGIDKDFFYPGNFPQKFNGRMFEFTFVGRLHAEKNLSFLLVQLANLRAITKSTFMMNFVGDGPKKEELEKQASKLGIDGIIKWHGWLTKEKVLRAYQSAHCLINPSLYEGMPNVVLEAMACGLPVIASHVPGNDALVRHGQTGFLFDLKHPEELVGALKTLLENPEMACSMGQKGRAWVEKNSSWDKVAEEYIRLFQNKTVQEN